MLYYSAFIMEYVLLVREWQIQNIKNEFLDQPDHLYIKLDHSQQMLLVSLL